MSVIDKTDNNNKRINLRTALEERYLAYALSTITQRALPDVRDGLKPVHRRLLYAMLQLKLNPDSGFKKCARVVGDVIGKFHPHGDQSVYDALVRLAQEFAVRYPLVEGQGNFGNIDGDNAAAMRYTEARLTEFAQELLKGISEDTVDFVDTYDGEENEPIVLPGAVPNLLANGSSGIAVGMATSIPPHNVEELCQASLLLIEKPETTTAELVEIIHAPDFPTGGVIIDSKNSIVEAYETGKGGFKVRAKWGVEKLPRGAYQIVITEMPYQVQKSRLIEKIADLIQSKKLNTITDVRDESAEDIRLIIEPRNRTSDPVLIMETLFKLTDLESRISLNMNVLSMGKVPMVLGIKEVLKQWLKHRQVVLVRQTNYRLEKIAHRLEILGGYMVAYLNLDEVIRIIREEDHPKQELMNRFNLSDIQAEAILNMRLRSLRKLEEIEIKTEFSELEKEQEKLQELVNSERKQWQKISQEINCIIEKFGKKTIIGKRRTEISSAPEVDFDIEQAMIEKEPVTIICSQKGWIRAIKGHIDDISNLSFKEGDECQFNFKAYTTDKILVLTSSGKFFTLGADRLPGGRGHGEPIRLMADIEQNDAIVSVFPHKEKRRLLLASNIGNGFITKENDIIANTRKGKQALNVKKPDQALRCVPINDGDDYVAVIGENRKLLIFPLSGLPEMARGKGVRLQRYRGGGLSDIKSFKLEDGLSWIDSSDRNWNVKDLEEWIGIRAQAGKLPPKGFPRNNMFS